MVSVHKSGTPGAVAFVLMLLLFVWVGTAMVPSDKMSLFCGGDMGVDSRFPRVESYE